VPITEDTVFRIASITKTLTAVAVMQLWEQGLVDLDRPANDYLRSYRLVPARAGYHRATVRQLLTHTAGLGEVAHLRGHVTKDFGESVPAGQALPSLAEFYGGALRTYAEPGTRFVYNNHGPSTVGQIVEDVSGLSLSRYVRERIFEPLGMTDSELVRSERVSSRLATGYEIRSGGVVAVAERDLVTTGAASAYSTPRDMARYLAALLGGGRSAHGSILEPGTVGMMFAPHYQPDPRVPGMGLAFFRSNVAGHLVVGHQGTLPGFHSQISLAPEDGVGAMAFTNGGHQPDFWLSGAVHSVLGDLLGADSSATTVPHHPELWDDLRGWYRLSARLSDTRLRALMGAGVEVYVRRGQLLMRFLTPIPALARGSALQPDDAEDPFVFRIDLPAEGMEPIRVVFAQDGAGATDRLCVDIMPLTFHKQPATTNPRMWAVGVVGTLGAAATARAVLGRRAPRAGGGNAPPATAALGGDGDGARGDR
jgi:CubicO group peptidase (beta-lactamase class C family)